MFKVLKRLLLGLVVILVGLSVYAVIFVRSIEYQVTADDLPQDVYDSSGDLLSFAKVKMIGLMTATSDQRYTLIEEIMNLVLYDSIRKNINPEYDPLGDCGTTSCERIVESGIAYINYAFASLNNNDQLVITISGGTDRIASIDTALILVFDIALDDVLTPTSTIVLTLNRYSLGAREMSMSLLNMIFNRMDKASIEASMTFGTLDLDQYTYSISLADALL